MFRLSSVLVWRKLLILGLISLILCAIPTLLYVRQANKEIDVVKQELRGLEPSAKLLSVLQHMQMHRGLSSAILGGNASFADQRAAREKDTTAALATFREAMPAKASTIIQTLDKIEAEWKSLSSAVKDRSYSAEDSYNRHTKLLTDLLRVLELTVDYYGLTLDPENQSHFLIVASYTELPRLAEALDQMRARGTSMLTFKQATGEDRVLMASLIEKSRERIDSSKAQMQKVFDANDVIKTRLDPALSAAQTDAHKFVAVSDLEFVRIEMLRYDAGEYLALATNAIDFQFKLIAANATELEQLLQSRLSEYRLNMVLLLALVGTVLLGSALLTWRITRSIVLPLSMAVKNAESIAEGRLDTRINVSGNDELGKLLRAMGRMQANLGRMVFGIRETSESVASASREIAGSTQDISARTEEQASSLEETSASMEEMNSTVRQNDNNSQHASELAMQASDVAHQGGAAVGKMAKTMVDIETSSKKIADIIGVIDSIAFQTNILALNAAVEAARAGEQGRGFAVVAAEVRTLAQRSGQAAKEIRALIADSVQKVGVGAKDAAAAGKTMESVVASIKRVADAMSEIRIASQEQLQGIAQVTRAVEQMNQGTQYSTATVEQVAATADMLSEQAQRLTKAVAAFSLSARHDYNQSADGTTERDNNISVATADRPSLSGGVDMATAPHALASTAGAPLLTDRQS